MKNLIFVFLIIFAFNAVGYNGAKPLHRLLSGDKYYVVYDNNYIVEYDIALKRTKIINDDTKRFGNYPDLNADQRASRIVVAVPDKYIIIGCVDSNNKSMPLWKATLPNIRWTKLTDGEGLDSPFAVACNSDYIVGAPIDSSTLLRINLSTNRVDRICNQP